MIKNELRKKLGLYSLASGAIAMATGNAEAQVTYTDINPDEVVSGQGDSYIIDLNNDGTDDFTFSVGTAWSGGEIPLYINPMAGAAVLGSAWGSSGYKAVRLSDNDAIPVTPTGGQNWGGSAMLAVNVPGSGSDYGNFHNATNKYIGLRLRSGVSPSFTYTYGWVRINLTTSTNTITIKDMAYNATVGTSLVAGEGIGTSIAKNQELLAQTHVFVNADNEIVLENNTAQAGKAEVLNTSGTLSFSKEISGGKTVLSSQGLSSGIYVVRITVGDATVARKVFLR